MGLTWLAVFAATWMQGVNLLETPEFKRYARELSRMRSFDVACSSTRPTGGGRIWKRGDEIRVRVGDKVYEKSRGGWLLRDLLTSRNKRLEWYDDVPLVELLMLVPRRGEPASPPPKAYRMTREVPTDGQATVEVGYRMADTHVDVRTTMDFWFSPVTGLLKEIGWRSEGMTQPSVNSLRLEWTLNPESQWPPVEFIKPTSDFGQYEILPGARDTGAYVEVILPQGVTGELEALCGETRVKATSNRLEVRGTPGTVGGVFVNRGGLAVRFHARMRLTINCGAVRNAGRRARVVGGEKISPGQTVPFLPREYPEEGRAKPVVVKPGKITVLK